MSFRISVNGKGYDTEILHLDGQSGTVYPFIWDKMVGRYCFEPSSQEQIDDIFETMTPESMFFFSVVAGSGEGLPSKTAGSSAPLNLRPTLEPRYYQDLDADELAALAKDCGIKQGITSCFDESLNGDQRRREVWRRVCDAFYLGAGWKAANPAAAPAPVAASAGDGASDVTKVIQFPLTEQDELRVLEYVQENITRLRKEQPSLFNRSGPAKATPKAAEPKTPRATPLKKAKAAAPDSSPQAALEPAPASAEAAAATG